MTPSNDLILDSGYWLANLEKEHMLRLHIFEAMSIKPLNHLDPPKYDLKSVTEPESDLNVPPKPQILLQPLICNLESVIQPLICDPDNVTESESELDIPSKHTPNKTELKGKPFFKTPSPPSPDSIYWKYMLREEDARWYD
ncbi:hypothetical protein EDD22DRAFT_960784 [Suillus occidentalis]|nr:hypothetical protein EDD22DRAFT_960784 [Suillus occidentalis]